MTQRDETDIRPPLWVFLLTMMICVVVGGSAAVITSSWWPAVSGWGLGAILIWASWRQM